MENALGVISVISFIAATVGIDIFIVIYLVKKPWKENGVGSVFTGFMLILTVIMNLAVLFDFVEGSRLLIAWLSAVLYTIFAVMIWMFTFGLIKSRLKK